MREALQLNQVSRRSLDGSLSVEAFRGLERLPSNAHLRPLDTREVDRALSDAPG